MLIKPFKQKCLLLFCWAIPFFFWKINETDLKKKKKNTAKVEEITAHLKFFFVYLSFDDNSNQAVIISSIPNHSDTLVAFQNDLTHF